MSSSAARVVGAVGLNDIVLDERAGSPAVQSDQTVIISIYGSSVVNCAAQESVKFLVARMSSLPCRAGCPTDTSNNIGVGTCPLKIVSASSNREGVRASLNVVRKIVAAIVASFVVSDGLTTLLDVIDGSS